MSANASRGRKAVDPNETETQKLVRVANARVTKLLTQIQLVGNLGAMIKDAAAKDGVNADAVVSQIWQVFAKEAATLKARLETGERAKDVFSLQV